MKLYFNSKVGILLLFLLLGSTSMMQAAHGKTAPSTVEFQKILKKEKPQRGLLKKIIAKKNKRAASKEKSISRPAITSIVAGGLALLCLFAPLLISVGTGIWLLGALFAIIGDIAAIVAFRRNKKSDNPTKKSKNETLATVGLVMSLLAGLIPLILLIIVLATI